MGRLTPGALWDAFLVAPSSRKISCECELVGAGGCIGGVCGYGSRGCRLCGYKACVHVHVHMRVCVLQLRGHGERGGGRGSG